ncbi:Phospholipase [Cichlidogyrus casuarinus]|uniref:phospholipase D n=1 Tax=Cichlidogyrus casuarinus TaxID=1844966 RepID=A0ABD2PRD3_9PLAT
MEGELGTPTGEGQQIILHYLRMSIYKGPSAIIPRLQAFIDKPEEYISICMLRKWETWPDGRLTHEMVYVHNKLMIVDDKRVIVGSANINDRSMLGSRDSELAMLIEDELEEVNEVKHFDGASVVVGKFARRFRRILMAEHLGVLSKEQRANADWDLALLDDPVGDDFFHGVWVACASKNAEIMEEVFLSIPSNNLKTFQHIINRRTLIPMSRSDPDNAKNKLNHHRGQLEIFPADFLSNENLLPSWYSVNNMVPTETWT